MAWKLFAGAVLALVLVAPSSHAQSLPSPDDDAPFDAGPGAVAPPDPEAAARSPVVGPRQRAAALRHEGKALQQAGKHALARAKFEAAMLICETEMAAEPACVAATAAMLGNLAATDGRSEDARTHFQHALIATEQTFGASAPQLAPLQFKLGKALAKLRDWRGAAQAFNRSVDLIGRTPGPKHPFAAEALIGLAQAYMMMNRTRDMREPLERAIGLCPGSENGASACKGRAHHMLGGYYKRLHRPDDALREWDMAAQAYAQAGDLSGQVTTLTRVGATQREMGRLPEAETSLRRVLTLEATGYLGGVLPMFGPAHLELAHLLKAEGRTTEAAEAAQNAIRRCESGEAFKAELASARTLLAELGRAPTGAEN